MALIFAGWACLPTPASAEHVCDPADEAGWRVIATNEVVAVSDGSPYLDGTDWLVERTTTLLPLCNYIDPLGSYSLRSYSLDPIRKRERIMLCRDISTGASVPVSPYTGPCPPR